MGLSIQYYNGTDYTQLPIGGLDVADYTLAVGIVADIFYSIKDSNDTAYVFCGRANTGSDSNYPKAKVIKITSSGVITVSSLSLAHTGNSFTSEKRQFVLSRDEQTIFLNVSAGANDSSSLFRSFLVSEITGTEIVLTTHTLSSLTVVNKLAIYQDRYIWVASGTTVKIYDYTTKAELASIATTGVIAMCADYSNTNIKIHSIVNQAYDFYWGLATYEFVGDNIIQTQYTAGSSVYGVNIKQILIDRFGDLIILTNSGTASTLLKYTTAGVQVGTTLDLGGAFYNLNTDKDGNYYYSNALGTYKITAPVNAAQGWALTGVGSKIRGSGMTTYGNNITNYNPAVFGTQE